MIIFNPKKLYLRSVENVEIFLRNSEKEKIVSMDKDIDGVFTLNIEKGEYTNYHFLVGDRKIYPHKIEACIISTMSSGKSTFINSLIGKEILPSENEACTGKIFKIEKVFSRQRECISLKEEGKIKRYLLNEDYLKELNKNQEGNIIEITSYFQNIKENICLYDTPGVNNSQDKNHREVTYNFIKNSNIKNYIYLLNATQLGVNDDREFLVDLKEMGENKNIIFILNKIDEIDREKENLEEIIENTKNYIKKNGFTDFKIFPTSAYNCKLLRFALNGEKLTRSEMKKLIEYYKSSSLEEEGEEIITIGGEKLFKRKIEKLIESTGIPQVEKAMENLQIFSPSFSMRIERDI